MASQHVKEGNDYSRRKREKGTQHATQRDSNSTIVFERGGISASAKGKKTMGKGGEKYIKEKQKRRITERTAALSEFTTRQKGICSNDEEKKNQGRDIKRLVWKNDCNSGRKLTSRFANPRKERNCRLKKTSEWINSQ